MKELSIYALETLACGGILLVAYSILLERRVRFVVCRAYLLFAVAASAAIPALDIPVWEGEVLYAVPAVPTEGEIVVAEAVADEAAAPDPRNTVLAIYVFGVVLSFVIMAVQMIRMRRLSRDAERTAFDRFDLVRTPHKTASFSFFRTVYVGSDVSADDLRTIIAHEASHIVHRHSVERVAMEVMKAFMWWNPFVWIAARRLVEVQEYEADRDVIDGGYDVSNYISTLLKHLFGYSPEIANGLRDSLTKKRLKMMTMKRGGRYALLRTAAVVPVIAGLLATFSLTAKSAEIRYIEPVSETAAEGAVEFVAEENADFASAVAATVTAAALATDGDKAPKKSAEKTEPVPAQSAEAVFFLDGKRIDRTALNALDIADIVEMKVVKDPAFEELKGLDVSKAEVARGIVLITTKNAPDGLKGKVISISKNGVDTTARRNVSSISVNVENGVAVVEKSSTETGADNSANKSETVSVVKVPASGERVEVTTGNGDKTLTIGGMNAVFTDKKPLVIIDGKALEEGKSLNDIPANSIKSVIIYKDGKSVNYDPSEASKSVAVRKGGKTASAYGIYGDTSNGVILVETKSADGGQGMTVKIAGNGDAAVEGCDEMPKFNGGGIVEFRRWVLGRIRYPEAVRKAGTVGNVVASFAVGADGSVEDVKILKSPDEVLSNEVRRVLAASPKWTAGKRDGKAVKVSYTLPVSFAISTSAGLKGDADVPKGSVDAVSVVAYGD